ncbi:MAG: tRNA (N6-threonylcarbamoyladenosine(37)-N6)-methyltransferase TrmO [Nitrososphaeria archaeon]|jgi:tRNA-Thr(GGU) m(6)t(6)A37 methyltransferase TsaA
MFDLTPIGVVHTDVKDEDLSKSGSVVGRIEVFQDFREGLNSIEGFPHLILITFLDRVSVEAGRTLKIRFRHLQQAGLPPDILPEVGVFASDSPKRPNPVGVSIVKTLEFDGRFIKVSGLDVYDGTPVIDIKPYTPYRRIQYIKVPEWFSKISLYLDREP